LAERRIVVDNLRLSYEGLFNLNELYLIMDKWFRERGYDKFERKNFEHVYKEGRQIEMEIMPWKKITDYAKIQTKIIMLFTDIKDTVIQVDGKDVRMNSGKCLFTFQGYLETDYEHKWESKAVLLFIRAIWDMWISKINTDKYEAYVADETMHLYQTIKAYLNLNRYKGI